MYFFTASNNTFYTNVSQITLPLYLCIYITSSDNNTFFFYNNNIFVFCFIALNHVVIYYLKKLSNHFYFLLNFQKYIVT